MSTRSGKRIHSSPHSLEIIGDTDISHSEIKTRSKRNKDCEEDNLIVKTRKHYVKYPCEETSDDIVHDAKTTKPLRKSRRHTLKDRNACITVSEVSEEKHTSKQTRRNKKKDEIENRSLNSDNQDNNENKDKKKSKKKKRPIGINENEVHSDQNAIAVPKKKSNKRKIKKKSGSIIVKDLNIADKQCKVLNGSRISDDSFHSAAGSPKANDDGEVVKTNNKSTPKNNIEKVNVCAISPIVNDSSNKKNSKRYCSMSSTHLSISNQELKDTDNERQNDVQHDAVNMSYDIRSDDNDGGGLQMPSLNCKSSISNGATDKIEDSDMSVNHKLTNSNDKKKKKSKKPCDSEHNITHEDTGKAKLIMSFNETETSFNKLKKKDTTFEKTQNISFDKTEKSNTTFNKENLDTTFDKSNKFNSTFNRSKEANTTFDKSEKFNITIDKTDKTNISFDKIEKHNTTFDKIEKTNTTIDKSNTINTTFDKIEKVNITFDKTAENIPTNNKTEIINTIFEKTDISIDLIEKPNLFDKQDNTRKSKRISKSNVESNDSTLEVVTKELCKKTKGETDTTFNKISNDNSNDSVISSDVSKGSHISLTSDESHSENILNNTPLLVESSMEEGNNDSKITSSPPKEQLSNTPLKREGTFTKESPEIPLIPKATVSLNNTPTRRKSLPSPGCTPFPLNKSSSKDKVIMNVTHSIEKSRRSSLAELIPRSTKVMFCSPSNNPVIASQIKGKIIKSSLKGSNKSFIFDDSGPSLPMPKAGRKRSQTQAVAEPRAKRSRLLTDPPPERVRARTVSATVPGKIPGSATSATKVDTPTKGKDAKLVRTKLPNFAALHMKQFAKMESLDECQERKAKRARQLLTPNGALAFLERISPKENQVTKPPEPSRKSEAPSKSKPGLNRGYSRFGFKLNCDSKPFSFTAKNTEVKKVPEKLTRQATMPSMSGVTLTHKEVAKQTVMREKSFTGKRDVTRTVIKGVRTNRRFELQMKMRNVN